MNKKKIALVLTLSMMVNSLVSSGIKGGQVFVYAQDVKLSPDKVDKLKSIGIKTLETSVVKGLNDEVIVSFNNIDTSNIVSAIGKFKHRVFSERVGIDGNSNDVIGKWKDGKFVVDGVEEPGIYRGDVDIVYKDGSSEVYNLTLVKKPSDTLSFVPEVSVGKIQIKNLTLNNGVSNVSNFKPTKVVLSLHGGKSVELKESSGYSASILDLKSDGKLNEKDKLTLSVEYGENGEYSLSSPIVLTRKEEKITRVFASNDTLNFVDDIVNSIKEDYSAREVEFERNKQWSGVYDIYADENKVASFTQTVTTVKVSSIDQIPEVVGGALLDVETLDDTTIKVSLTPPTLVSTTNSNLENNYVPTMWIFSGKDKVSGESTGVSGLGGEYNFTLGSQAPILYFDALKEEHTTEGVVDGNVVYLKIAPNLPESIDNLEASSVTVNLENDLEHGYQVIEGTFTLDTKKSDALLDEGNRKVQDEDTLGITTRISGVSTVSGEDEVKTSVILAADVLEGDTVYAKFTEVSSSEGKVTLYGGSDLLKDLTGAFNYDDPILTLDGVRCMINAYETTEHDLVFDVKFSGEIPKSQSAKWNLKIKDIEVDGIVDLTNGLVESVNLVKAEATNNGTEDINNQFRIDAMFGSSVPLSDNILIDDLNSDRVTFDQFKNGSHVISTNVSSGKYRGVYSAGIIVQNFSIAVDLKILSTTSNSVITSIDLELFGGNSSNVQNARLEYKEKGQGWENANKLVIENSEIKDEIITKIVTGLSPKKTYEFRAVYNYKEGEEVIEVLSNEEEATTLEESDNGGGSINGGGSSNSQTTTINVTNNNSVKGSTSISVNLPSTVSYNNNTSFVTSGVKYKNSDGKIITESNKEFSNISCKVYNNKLLINGLVPGKEYSEIVVKYNDKSGKSKTLVFKNIKIDALTELEKYLVNVYKVVFNRPADEVGYHFHLSQLKDKKGTLRAFLLNMLSEKEFLSIYKTPDSKIEALYSAIVNRGSDSEGKNFWINEYNKLLKVYGSQEITLRAIVDRMVNENELRELSGKLNVIW